MGDCAGLLSKETRQEMRMQMDVARHFHHFSCTY